MRTLVVVVGLLVATSAAAKPLPKGMKVITKLGRPYVQQGQVTVALRDDDLADYEKLGKAELDADGKTIRVIATRCKGTLTDDITTVPLAKVQARLDNALGLVAHGKKRYGEAITRFTAAAQKDPETASYGTSLLAAQLLGKKPDAAGQTIAVHGRRNPVWLLWRVQVDADLAAAKAHKRTKDLAAPTAGTATIGTLGERDLATTTAAGGIAALRTLAIGSPGTLDVDFVSLTTGRLLARMPLIALEDACDLSVDSPCDDAAKARIAERTKLVDSVLATLGFTIQANAFADVRNGDPVRKDGVVIETTDDSVTVTRGAEERTLALDGHAWSVAVTPKAAVIMVNRRNLYACDDGSSRFVGVALALP